MTRRPRGTSSPASRRQEIRERQQVFHPKARAAAREAHVRVGRQHVGPAERYGIGGAVGELEGDPLLPPEPG